MSEFLSSQKGRKSNQSNLLEELSSINRLSTKLSQLASESKLDYLFSSGSESPKFSFHYGSAHPPPDSGKITPLESKDPSLLKKSSFASLEDLEKVSVENDENCLNDDSSFNLFDQASTLSKATIFHKKGKLERAGMASCVRQVPWEARLKKIEAIVMQKLLSRMGPNRQSLYKQASGFKKVRQISSRGVVSTSPTPSRVTWIKEEADGFNLMWSKLARNDPEITNLKKMIRNEDENVVKKYEKSSPACEEKEEVCQSSKTLKIRNRTEILTTCAPMCVRKKTIPSWILITFPRQQKASSLRANNPQWARIYPPCPLSLQLPRKSFQISKIRTKLQTPNPTRTRPVNKPTTTTETWSESSP